MKSIYCILGAGLIALSVGCASTPVALSPVGPDPAGVATRNSDGQLLVYSKLVGRTEGRNPTWHQHSDYYIYDLNGNLVKHVGNTIGYYERAPRPVPLPPGDYLVKARAQDYFWVQVPVTIERGRTTRVHLDDNWRIPSTTTARNLVTLPNGNPVGWSAQPM